MSNLPFQLISTDFDGTLFAEFESPPVPQALQALIGQLQRRGARWVINTGRDMSSLMECLGRARLSVQPDFLVLVEREIYLHTGARYVGLAEWNERCRREQEALFARVRPEVPQLVAWIQARFEATVYEDLYSPFCLVAANNGDAEAIHRHLEAFCQTMPDLTIVRNDVYARFSHRAFSKGTALKEIARQLGLGSDQTVAAGDHLNDLPMLSREHARFLVAPANAVDLVKEAVRRQHGYVSRQARGDGVLEGLAYHLGGTAPEIMDFHRSTQPFESF